MRGFASKEDIGKPLFGEQVAKWGYTAQTYGVFYFIFFHRIIESKNDKYPVGEFVVGSFGWRTHTIGTEKNGKFGFPAPRLVPDIGNLPKSLMLGVLGMPGYVYSILSIARSKTILPITNNYFNNINVLCLRQYSWSVYMICYCKVNFFIAFLQPLPIAIFICCSKSVKFLARSLPLPPNKYKLVSWNSK